MTIHFSVLGERGICGNGPSKRGEFNFTAVPLAITCERCKSIVRDASATAAHVWALEAEQSKERSQAHVRQLYALAVKKQVAEVERKRSALEYAEEQLVKVMEHAVNAGTPEDLWTTP